MSQVNASISLKTSFTASSGSVTPVVGQVWTNSQVVTDSAERVLTLAAGTYQLTSSTIGLPATVNALRVRRVDTTSATTVVLNTGVATAGQVPPLGVGADFAWFNGDSVTQMTLSTVWTVTVTGGSAQLYFWWA